MTKKNKGKKVNNNEAEKTRDLEFKQEMEEYAKVTALLGDRKIRIALPDGVESFGVIPGKFRKRVWIAVDDVVLVSKRSFQDNKMDVLHKYTESEVKNLIQYFEIPESFGRSASMLNDISNHAARFDSFMFEEGSSEVPVEVDFDDI
jgi:translation initiation factor 1A